MAAAAFAKPKPQLASQANHSTHNPSRDLLVLDLSMQCINSPSDRQVAWLALASGLVWWDTIPLPSRQAVAISMQLVLRRSMVGGGMDQAECRVPTPENVYGVTSGLGCHRITSFNYN